jgi:small-conductance mechanosensitive channel
MHALVPNLVLAAQDAGNVLEDELTSGEWIRAGLIFAGAIVAAAIVSRVTRYLIERWVGPGFAALLTGRLIAYVVVLLGMFYALTTLGVQVGPLLGALGLGGLVLALALQKVVEDFVAAIILQTRRPFTVGETVIIADRTGTVIDIDSRTTVLRDLDGRIVRIPNSRVVEHDIINLTREPVRRSSLVVGVAYDTNLREAFSALTEALGRTPRVLSEPPPMVALGSFGSSSIDFVVYYWHASDVPSELAARHDLILAVHQALASQGITIAFPQVVVWEGSEAHAATYELPEPEIRVEHPAVDEPVGREDRAPRRRPAQWLLPRRSSSDG